jgi:glycosyltransferase involved in cell wall biosynthesis
VKIPKPVLLSAYACEPDKGSEPGIGWNLAANLASRVPVVVLTRANNQALINKALVSIAPEKRPEFIYHDLAEPLIRLKKLLKAHRWYYLLWQKAAKRKVSRLVSTRSVALIHHATYASFRYPTAVLGHGVPAIWGPVGGVESTPWNLMPWSHPTSLPYEVARNVGILQRRSFPESEWKSYARVLASTHETHDFFSSAGIRSELMPAIGLDEPSNVSRKSAPGALRLLFVGPLHYLKGVHFVIEALVGAQDTSFTIVGTGPFESTLRALARKMNVQDRVRFTGQMPQAELKNIYLSHDVFVFPSLHDSGGMAVLEAMNSELPVICLDCGGPALSVSDKCGFKIAPSNRRAIVDGIREALQRYSGDRELLAIQGRAARNRVETLYAWPNKVTSLLQIYDEVLSATKP